MRNFYGYQLNQENDCRIRSFQSDWSIWSKKIVNHFHKNHKPSIVLDSDYTSNNLSYLKILTFHERLSNGLTYFFLEHPSIFRVSTSKVSDV